MRKYWSMLTGTACSCAVMAVLSCSGNGGTGTANLQNGPDPNTNPDDGPPAGNPDGGCPIPAEAAAD
jgi:hypothetical protein